MGGRGASSMGGRFGLPKNARAVTITGKNGRSMTFYKSSSGTLLMSRTAGAGGGLPAGLGNVSIGDIYRNAKEAGYSVSLISKSEFDKNTAKRRAEHEELRREVGYAEMHPGAGRAGIPARRLLYKPRRK